MPGESIDYRRDDWRLAGWLVQPALSQVTKGDVTAHLKPKAMAVLAELAHAHGQTVTRQALFDAIWPGGIVSDDTLTQCIVEIRRAFGDSAREPRLIRTVPKKGFRLLEQPQLTAMHTTKPRVRQARGGLIAASIVAALAITLTVLAAGTRLIRGDSAEAIQHQSVAVLPFADMSAEGDQAYFADGLAEELINQLSQLDGLLVSGRTSSFYFKDRGDDLQTIGRTLGVAHVLEGSVRKSGDALRVTAQLVDVQTGFHVWSASYDRGLTDVFEVQDQIAGSVADALSVQLAVGQLGQMPGGTRNVEAFEELMLGNALYSEFTAQSMLAASRKALAD